MTTSDYINNIWMDLAGGGGTGSTLRTYGTGGTVTGGLNITPSIRGTATNTVWLDECPEITEEELKELREQVRESHHCTCSRPKPRENRRLFGDSHFTCSKCTRLLTLEEQKLLLDHGMDAWYEKKSKDNCFEFMFSEQWVLKDDSKAVQEEVQINNLFEDWIF